MNTTNIDSINQLMDLLESNPTPTELEITILPLSEDMESHTSFLKHDVHLGIHSLHVPKLAKEYRECYYSLRRLYSDYKAKGKRKDSNGNDNGDVNDVNDGTSCDKSILKQLHSCTQCLLLLCPDHASAWSDRKSLLLDQSNNQNLSSLEVEAIWNNEIQFLNLLFSQHSKAPNSWGHRQWVCRQQLKLFQQQSINIPKSNNKSTTSSSSSPPPPPSPPPQLELLLQWCQEEIKTCIRIAEKYPKNYYAWTHRTFLIRSIVSFRDLLLSSSSSSSSRSLSSTTSQQYEFTTQVISLLEREFRSIETWLKRSVSDHSAAHFGSIVLRHWLDTVRSKSQSNNDNDSNNTKDTNDTNDTIDTSSWDNELCILNDAMNGSKILNDLYPSNEVIWIWKRICSGVYLERLSYMLQKANEEYVDGLVKVFQTFLEENVLVFLKNDQDVDGDCQGTTSTTSSSSVHCITYVFWIVERIRDCGLEKWVHINMIHAQSQLLQSLSSNVQIPYEMWRLTQQ